MSTPQQNPQPWQKKPFQTTEESLHWISFNLKKLVQEVKEIKAALSPKQGSGSNEEPNQW